MAIDTILVAIGRGDERADRVERLAEVIGEYEEAAHPKFVLLHVFDADEREELAGEMDVAADADSDLIARRHAVTRELTDRLDAAGADYNVRGRVSDETAEAVIQVADAVDADRIITLGRTRTPTGKVVFGSVSQQILLNAHCPVTYVGVE